ncbi:MAG: family 16 glycoside hydrolase [Mariniblastus sp.]
MVRKLRYVAYLAVTLICMAGLSNTTQAQDDGFKPIFDGKTLEGWKGLDGFWSVQDGAIVGQTSAEKPLKKNTFLVWQEEGKNGILEDFELRFKFRISGEGSNSGVQFRCVQDETGHLVGYQADIDRAGQWLGIIYDEKTGRGAICDRGEKVSIDEAGKRSKEQFGDKAKLFEKVDVDAWTDYVIKANGNHLVIMVNGEKTADLTDIQTDHADLSGVLGLQLHTGPPMKIEFKDIHLKRMEKAVSDTDTGFKPIFDGKSLEGWTGKDSLWRVEDGAIVGQTKKDTKLKANEFLVWNQGEVDDFVLRTKFRVSGTERANSGIQFRSSVIEGTETRLSGYQADIDRSGKYIGILYSERTGRGILCQRGQKVTIRGKKDKTAEKVSDPAELLKKIDMDGWNEMEVTASGNHLVVKINGQVTADVTDEEAEQYKRRGLIGLQLHVGPPMKIEFKDIHLKRLPLQKTKKIVFIAGKKSHGYGSHEHNAGCLLLAKALEATNGKDGVDVLTTVYKSGWPADPTATDNADTVVVYCDGGGRHYLHKHGEAFEEIMRNGVGLACIHYGVEVPKGISGQRFLNWIGGYFETDWSVNPHWLAKFEKLPKHDVTRGVEPFEMQDEWYYHMRFSQDMTRVTPLLSCLPPKETLTRKDGPHSGNPHVRKAVMEDKQVQHVSWAFERGDGKGRGFGFTGGHFHNNWQNDNFRKLVLNAIVWTAHGEVPTNGIQSASPSESDLAANQDYPKPAKKNK